MDSSTEVIRKISPRVHSLLKLFRLDDVFEEAEPGFAGNGPNSTCELPPDGVRLHPALFSAPEDVTTTGSGLTATVALSLPEHEGQTISHYQLVKKLGEG